MIAGLLTSASSLQSSLPVVFDAAIKGAVLVVIAGVAAYLLRHRAAASRHAVWTAAVIGHLAIPLLAFVLPAWDQPLLPSAPWMQGTVANAPIAETGGARSGDAHAERSDAPTNAAKAKTPLAQSASSNGADVSVSGITTTPTTQQANTARVGLSRIQIFAGLWLIGALLVLLRLAIGTWQVGQLAREGARVEDGLWLSLTQRLANRLGVTRPLTLLRGQRLAVPVTWGIVYPAVLLPEDADSWSEERRRFVLVHEMAHVKRFDALTQLLAQLSVAIFWFDPLVWFAAHQMRVEREHACDDYVIRDGTAPSLYAGELLEMVRSIGTREHSNTAPAFAALAMARRSEFEGRMLAILDPRLDRHKLNGRGTLMTAFIVALLAFPLAAWRPFEQPVQSNDEFPKSFKVSISEPAGSATASPVAANQTAAGSTTPASPAIAAQASRSSPRNWTCEAYPIGTELRGTSTHIDAHENGADQSIQMLVSEPGRCTEASIIGKLDVSADETRIVQMPVGGFARFRERTSSADHAVSVTSAGNGSLNYTALLNGQQVPFDSQMQTWLAGVLPEVLREAGINVPERVARIRSQSGVTGVLKMISQIHSTGAKRSHYEALLDSGKLSSEDVEKIAVQAPRDLAGSSGDLSAIIQKLPRSAMQSPAARRALADAIPQIGSSGDRANALQILAPSADPEMLVLLAKAAQDLPSSGDKSNFLIATAAEYLSGRNQALTDSYFKAAATIPSSGDLANVLMTALPFGHANGGVISGVLEASKQIASSGDVANVLMDLVSQRVVMPDNTRATRAIIERTLSMDSSGDRANVLIQVAETRLLSTREVRDAFVKAAMALPSEGDRANVLAAAAGQQ
jgi:beta-lactamase regulating signal transducer with metallopeptidase domain